MKILLVDSIHIPMDFFPYVIKTLQDSVANLRVDSHTVSSDFAIPGFVAQRFDEYDSVLVYLTHTKDTFSLQKLNTVVSKLIDVEILKGIPIHLIIKDISNENISGEGKDEFGAEVAQYSHDLLFKPAVIQAQKAKVAEEGSGFSLREMFE